MTEPTPVNDALRQLIDAAIANLMGIRQLLDAVQLGEVQDVEAGCQHPDKQDVMGFSGSLGWFCPNPECGATSEDGKPNEPN